LKAIEAPTNPIFPEVVRVVTTSIAWKNRFKVSTQVHLGRGRCDLLIGEWRCSVVSVSPPVVETLCKMGYSPYQLLQESSPKHTLTPSCRGGRSETGFIMHGKRHVAWIMYDG